MQPFAGIKILDLTHVLAGPFCTYQLAVLGASVIKIEAPGGGDMVRGAGVVPAHNAAGLGSHYLTQNSNKRAMALDLKQAEGRAILKRLAAAADVFVENYRAGALASLGLGYADLSSLNPRLVYCSLTAFGQTGLKAGRTGYDNVIQATSGLMAGTGTAESGPLKVGSPVVDYGTGTTAAFAVAAALLQRTHTGKGQHIDVAMMDAALMLASMDVTNFSLTGRAPQPHGNSSPRNAGYACYETADGLLMLGAYTVAQQARLWRALGVSGRETAVSFDDMARLHDGDAAFLAATFRTRSASEWEELLNAAGVPAARVRTLDEALTDPQTRARGAVHVHEAVPGLDRPLTVPVAGFGFAEDGPAVGSPPPTRGQHTDEILAELGLADDAARLRAQGVV